MGNNMDRGFFGEDLATKYLISHGYQILDRNYRTKIGEIDIIAIQYEFLVFVEVKTRTNIDYGYPCEAVNWKKQDKIIKNSFIYMKQKNLFNYQVRYDIIEVFLCEKPKVNHIENAFCR